MVYKPNIPLPGDNLSVSQGDLKNNFGDANTSFGKNHYPFDDLTLNNGKHKFVDMPVSAAIPAGLAAGEGTFYTKTATSESNAFYSPDNSGDEYQMTRALTAQFTKFGTNTATNGTNNGGWTFLPGGLILQYGFNSTSGTSGIVFPFPFPTAVFSVTTSIGTAMGAPTLAGFTMTGTSPKYWMAIGK